MNAFALNPVSCARSRQWITRSNACSGVIRSGFTPRVHALAHALVAPGFAAHPVTVLVVPNLRSLDGSLRNPHECVQRTAGQRDERAERHYGPGGERVREHTRHRDHRPRRVRRQHARIRHGARVPCRPAGRHRVAPSRRRLRGVHQPSDGRDPAPRPQRREHHSGHRSDVAPNTIPGIAPAVAPGVATVVATIAVSTEGEQRGLLGQAVIGDRRFAAWTDPETLDLVVGEVDQRIGRPDRVGGHDHIVDSDRRPARRAGRPPAARPRGSHRVGTRPRIRRARAARSRRRARSGAGRDQRRLEQPVGVHV